ncbi:hypothetical protein TWF481_007589 [Arthrobotrys musiformis]|uniref:Uncharacterized protein n=1 Tax=Arthrobotrys musiformis TaxID=47236 RepID=A0AAV9WHN5_9PEZI
MKEVEEARSFADGGRTGGPMNRLHVQSDRKTEENEKEKGRKKEKTNTRPRKHEKK